MLDFHSKKVMCIHQEIYAHLIMYNFAEMITSHVVIEKKQRKYIFKANFSIAVHMCRLFYQEKAGKYFAFLLIFFKDCHIPMLT